MTVFVLIFFFLFGRSYAGVPSQNLSLVLDWFINPDHAPLFVAEEKGFFKEEGLKVTLLSPADSSDPPKLVAAQQADLALTYEPQFIDQIEQGLPLMTIGTLIDKPLNCLLTLDEGPVKNLADLKNKTIGSSSGGILALMLNVMLQHKGLDINEVKVINVRHNLVQALLAKKVAAITGVMRQIEPLELELSGHQARIFLPEDNGVPSYSELIFVVEKSKLQDPQFQLSLHHFLSALQKACAYLKEHPEECWQAFSKKYPALNNELNHRAWYATLPYFTEQPQQISAEKWRAFIDFMRQNKLIQSKRPLSDYLYYSSKNNLSS